MSLAEQVVEQLKTDMDNVYDAGYQKGVSETDGYELGVSDGQSLFGIQNEVTGAGIVTCDYVNENEHNVEVKLSSDNITDFSDKQVKVIGKNWWCLNNHYEGANFLVPITPFKFPKGKVGFSFNSDTENASYELTIYDENKTVIKAQSTDIVLGKNEAVFELTKECAFVRLYVSSKVAISDIQIELNTVTDYEPYTETTYTANADGTVDGVTSISPIMNIICEGVDISAKYFQNPSDFICEGEMFFTNHGSMYQRNTVVTDELTDGFYQNAYRNATKMKTFKAPYVQSIWSAPAYIFMGCTVLKEVSLPRIQRIGLQCFYDCISLETVLLGEENYPMISISNNAFQNCSALKNFNYIGSISGTFNLQWSSFLTVESAKNIIQCLQNFKGTNSDLTYTITFHADVWAKLEAEGNASPNGNTWREYVYDLGWNKG